MKHPLYTQILCLTFILIVDGATEIFMNMPVNIVYILRVLLNLHKVRQQAAKIFGMPWKSSNIYQQAKQIVRVPRKSWNTTETMTYLQLFYFIHCRQYIFEKRRPCCEMRSHFWFGWSIEWSSNSIVLKYSISWTGVLLFYFRRTCWISLKFKVLVQQLFEKDLFDHYCPETLSYV